ncbi:MAG: PAS domain-containing protein [Mycolicibacterium sp.]|uniref:PAS domain-containing protein n=1 Tax=Mycolicibacterium sp. TaxID=2320850 RepID=UPI003D0B1848
MNHDWMLVETLGSEPAVVAQGAHTKDLVPISAFLSREPHLMAIQSAIGETVRAGQGLTSITPKNDRVIRTEVVQMSDGRIHGVQIWVGAPDEEPPPRPAVGPLIWDLTQRTAIDTPESLRIGGWNPDREAALGRVFADDLPRRDLKPREAQILSMVIKPEEGQPICDTWDVTDYLGERITVGFVARSMSEEDDDGGTRLIFRAMNWRSVQEGPSIQENLLGQRILDSLAEPGVHRALVDPRRWSLLKWLDDPAPFFDWRAGVVGERAHPDDETTLARMNAEFANGATSGVLRMAAANGGWTPVHVDVQPVELDRGVYAGLAAFRLPTPAELDDPHLEVPDEPADRNPKGLRRKDRGDRKDDVATD